MAGSSGGKSSGGKKKARIEIIPLIDVIFFLLATFVLFTLSLNKSNGIAVALPKSETGDVRDPADSVTVSVTAEGSIAWNKDPITLQEFIDRLRTFHLQHPTDAKILLNGDENATFNSVFGYAVDEIRKAGIQKVFLETQVKQSGT
jgi:biopolymer transport protein ExbD